MHVLKRALPLLFAVCACDCRQAPAPPLPNEPLAGVANTASLDGTWRVTTRVKRDSDWKTIATTSVQVPGHAYPFNDKQPREVELVFERRFEVPRELARRRLVVEFDSVDYWATVELVDESGQARELGRHEGYLGRFAVELGRLRSGTLRVRARDRWEAAARDETYPRTTVQGIDPTGWGINPMGILGSVRLRGVGPTHLLNAYAARLAPTKLRLAAELIAAQPKAGQLHYELLRRGDAIARGAFDLSTHAGTNVVTRDIELSQAIDAADGTNVRVSVSHDRELSDRRTVPLVFRREPQRVKGVGVYYLSRLAPAPDATVADGLAKLAKPYHANSATPFETLARSTRELNANWIRPAHHVPPQPFFAAMQQHGLLVYQDFPLHWNTDWAALDEARILQQLDEFLWRMGNEPSVAMVALHNEPEIRDTRAAEHQRAHRLLETMVARAKERAPHLVVVGASGGAGTALFPPRDGFPLADDLIDKHAYFQSTWSPYQGVRQFPDLIAHLAEDARGATLWSEGGTPFYAHVIYLAHLHDRIIDHPAVAKHIAPHLKIAGHALTVRQFYAAVSCRFHDGVTIDEVKACAADKLATADDAVLIAHAKEHFFGGRDVVARPSDGDPQRWGRQIAAELFAVQLYEARIIRARGTGFVGFVPWEQVAIGVPASLADTSPAIRYGRELVAAAYAPRAVYARIPTDGAIEAFALNDGESLRGELVLEAGTERQRGEVVIPAGGLAEHRFEIAKQASPTVGEVRLDVGGSTVARYRVLLP